MANVIGRSGGTRAWRNANPGNIIDGATARGFGAIGRDDLGFAIFPDDSTGWAALLGLLRTAAYQALSVRDAIFKWAPPDSNDSATYAAFVAKQLGVAGTTPVRNLTAAQLTTMGEAIRQFEGWEVGTTATTPTAKTTTTSSSSSSSYPSAGKTKTGIDLVYVGAGGQTWQVAKKYADQFQGFVTDAFNLGLVKDNPKTDALETFYSSGGYNYRTIAGSTRLSNHAYGAAIDISGNGENYRTNNSIDPTIARQLAEKWGLRWGGDYKNAKDYMHFEVVGANGEDTAPAKQKTWADLVAEAKADGAYTDGDITRKATAADGEGVLGSALTGTKNAVAKATGVNLDFLDGITRTVYSALIAATGLGLVALGIYRTSTT